MTYDMPVAIAPITISMMNSAIQAGSNLGGLGR